ncbi:DUF2798 domain-containing protein [Cognaticolwellia mytili]|uniref:DUF2798 domain-containing protein n=1 Tax=Cognaticolwellia mytili TaxID=1888913 RepID=UPI000A17779E|nr:DUF2798 domain-containing protein [Cognaticolwellia mytili]
MSNQLKFKLLNAGLMSFLMALVMSGSISAAHASAIDSTFLLAWLNAFKFGWPIAFPTAFFMRPVVQYLVKKILPNVDG